MQTFWCFVPDVAAFDDWSIGRLVRKGESRVSNNMSLRLFNLQIICPPISLVGLTLRHNRKKPMHALILTPVLQNLITAQLRNTLIPSFPQFLM